MKKQVLVIHGGTTYPNYTDYIDSLKSIQLELSDLLYRVDWKDNITADLGDEYEVLVPRMPNTTNAQYNEWRIWFEKITPFLRDDTVLVGHSLGGIFLAKYLSENTLNITIKAVILVAAPFRDLESEKLTNFNLQDTFSKLNGNIENTILIQSVDDPVVPFEHVNLYKDKLPSSRVVLLQNNGHFNQEHFPELVSIIEEL